jgi:hypothetical protein
MDRTRLETGSSQKKNTHATLRRGYLPQFEAENRDLKFGTSTHQVSMGHDRFAGRSVVIPAKD